MLSIKAGITLQAKSPGHVVLDAKADSSNACRVLYIDSSSGSVKVNGINITGGYLSGQFSGAGVTIYAYVMGVDVILDRCSIYGNIATYGAGVSSHGSTVTFRGCNFYNNAASHLGGGIDIHSGNVTIDSCNMYGNTAAGGTTCTSRLTPQCARSRARRSSQELQDLDRCRTPAPRHRHRRRSRPHRPPPPPTPSPPPPSLPPLLHRHRRRHRRHPLFAPLSSTAIAVTTPSLASHRCRQPPRRPPLCCLFLHRRLLPFPHRLRPRHLRPLCSRHHRFHRTPRR